MKDIITGTTGLTGLLGSPVSHSISPLMHNESFRLLGLDYRYLCFEVGCQSLKEATEGLRALGARGWNLTMPNKALACSLADRLSDAARISGSVNTVVNDHGILTGHTTDGTGYMRCVEEAGFDLRGKVMTLLGAGGAATAILTQAALDGLKEIRVFNRRSPNLEKAATIADRLNEQTSCRVSIHDIEDSDDLKKSLSESHILTNATSVGMAPDTEACPIPDRSFLRPDLIVSDIIYNPRKTRLMKLAEEIGAPTVGGLYMLLYQGAASFELWTGKPMPVRQIKRLYFTDY